jgi:hypothetical protein
VFIVLHYLIREGNHKLVMEAIDRHRPQILDLSKIKNKKSAPETIQSMLEYKSFIGQMIATGCQSQIDHTAQGIMRRLSLSNGLFEETRRLQQLLESALYCKVCHTHNYTIN